MNIHRLPIWILAALLAATASHAYAQTRPAGGEEKVKPITPIDEDAAKEQAPAQQPAGEKKTAEGEGVKGKKGFDLTYILPVMLGVLVLMYIMSSRSRRKQQTKRNEMLASLKKGDKVTSIGGVVGTVIEIREDEVIVKVDETNNVRMRFARWAIRGVGDEAKTQGPQDKR